MKFIPGFNDRYALDEDGKVYSFNNFHKDEGNGAEIHGRINKFGYVQIRLTRFIGDKIRTYLVHRLMALTYIPNPENKPQVNHKNGKKHDNRLSNLEWATRSENKRHSIDILGEKPSRGMLGKRGRDNANSMPILQYTISGELVKEYDSITQASEILGISAGHISSAIKGKLKTHKGYIWKQSPGIKPNRRQT